MVLIVFLRRSPQLIGRKVLYSLPDEGSELRPQVGGDGLTVLLFTVAVVVAGAPQLEYTATLLLLVSLCNEIREHYVRVLLCTL
jgi:hypothetical protein